MRETAGLSIQRGQPFGHSTYREEARFLLSTLDLAPKIPPRSQASVDSSLGSQMNDVLDWCDAVQWALGLRITKAIYEHGIASNTSSDTANR